MGVMICFYFSWLFFVLADSTVKDFTSAVENVLRNDLVFTGLTPPETWLQQNGFIAAGGDVRDKERLTLEDAKKICMDDSACLSICFHRHGGFPEPNEIVPIDFKDNLEFHQNQDWWTLIKPASQVIGEVTNPVAVSQAVLYALKSAYMVLERLPYVIGNKEKRELLRMADKVQRHTINYMGGDSTSLGVLKALWVNIKRYLRSPLIQAYFEAVGDDVIPTPADQGIGLSFLPKSVDCDSKKTITLLEGVEMPRVGFGTWKLKGDIAYTSVLSALRAGYRHIDTAQSYHNEEEVGKAIRDFLSKREDVTRKDIFITTKLSLEEDFGSGKTRTAFFEQLKSLGLDYVDVYMIHKPKDPMATIEAWKEMEQLYEEGWIKALGLSNYNESLLDAFLPNVKHRPTYLQNKLDIYTQGQIKQTGTSLLERAMKEKIAVVAYSTLNMYPYLLSPLENAHVLKVSAEVGRTPAQVLLRWALQLGCAVIPQSTNVQHIRDNFQLFDFTLNEQQMFILNRVYQMSNLYGTGGVSKTLLAATAEGVKTEL